MAELPAHVSFEELIQSDLFTFYIGGERKPFVVHSKAIAATSSFFSALVNGGLSEAQTRCAELQDVEPGTFTRFLEYAYRRDYTVPAWTHVDQVVLTPEPVPEPEEEIPEAADEPYPAEGIPEPPAFEDDPVEVIPEPQAVEDYPEIEMPEEPAAEYYPVETVIASKSSHTWGSWGMSTKKKQKATMRQNFSKRGYLTENTKPISNLINDFKPTSNSSADQDFTPVFLAHAELYRLADMRLVYPLKRLVLHKLHSTLSDFSLYGERLGDVLELAKYAYDQGMDRSEDGKLDELRDLVVRYIACEPKAYGKHKEFKRLMDGEGEFAGDLWDVVSQELL